MHSLEIFDNVPVIPGFTDFRNAQKHNQLSLGQQFHSGHEATVIAFFILNNSKEYLGQDKPRGAKAAAWNIVMLVSIGATLASIVYYLVSLI